MNDFQLFKERKDNRVHQRPVQKNKFESKQKNKRKNHANEIKKMKMKEK